MTESLYPSLNETDIEVMCYLKIKKLHRMNHGSRSLRSIYRKSNKVKTLIQVNREHSFNVLKKIHIIKDGSLDLYN